MFTAGINIWAVLVALVVNVAIGMLWYGPLFGKQWLLLQGKRKEEMSGGGSAMILAAVSGLVMAYFLARVLAHIGADTPLLGIWNGLWIWFGFIAAYDILKVVYEKRPFNLYLIDMGYQFVWILVAGAIIGAWQ